MPFEISANQVSGSCSYGKVLTESVMLMTPQVPAGPCSHGRSQGKEETTESCPRPIHSDTISVTQLHWEVKSDCCLVFGDDDHHFCYDGYLYRSFVAYLSLPTANEKITSSHVISLHPSSIWLFPSSISWFPSRETSSSLSFLISV